MFLRMNLKFGTNYTSLLPESPRWLVSRDRDDEAFAILTKYHAEGDANSILVQAEMAQIRSTIKLEMENSSRSWMDMIRTPGMRRRVFISCFLGLFTQMSGNTLISYYQNLLFKMMGYTTTYAKTRINIANQCWSLINGVTIALVVTRFRRRWMFMLSAGSMTLVFMAMTIAFQRLQLADDQGTKNPSAQIASLVFFFAYSPCYNIGNNSLTYTYLVELFPYAQRTMGIGVEQMFGKLAGFFSVYVNPIALNAIEWKYFAIYCGWITFEFCFVYLMYPETYNRTLEELAFCKSTPRMMFIDLLLTFSQCSRTRNWPTRLSGLSRRLSNKDMMKELLPSTARWRLLPSSAQLRLCFITSPSLCPGFRYIVCTPEAAVASVNLKNVCVHTHEDCLMSCSASTLVMTRLPISPYSLTTREKSD
jgi:hypothetical protein